MKTLLMVFAISFTTLLASCAGTMQTYEGSELPPDKVAVIKSGSVDLFNSATVHAVDGVESGFNVAHAEVLPGEHLIKIRPLKITGIASYWAFRTVVLNAEAGHTYIALGKIIDEETIFVWIEDAETGLVVAGAKPDSGPIQAGQWDNEPYDLKGITLGMLLSDFKAALPHPDIVCSDEIDIKLDVDYIGQTICRPEHLLGYTIANQPVLIDYKFLTKDMTEWKDDRLYAIEVTFGHESFEAIKQAVKKKYGTPKESSVLSGTISGLRAKGDINKWFNETGSVTLIEHIGEVSVLLLVHTKTREEFERRKLEKESSSD